MKQQSTERTPWWSSIVTRITVVVAVLVASAALLSGWLVYRGGRDQVVREARADMLHTRDRAVERFGAFTTTLQDDITFLADNAPLRELALALDSADTALITPARARLALLMESFLRSRSQYTQVRMIGADSLGRELIRFDRSHGLVSHVPDSALQAKGDRDYYMEAMRLPVGAHYFSQLDLNKEHGRVEVPYVPTLRAAASVFTPHGSRVGIVVINADMRPLFQEIASLGDHGPVLLAGADGEVLVHPDSARTFRFEFGEHSTLDAALEGSAVGDTVITDETTGRIALRHRFEPPALRRAFELAVLRDTGPLLDGMRRERDRNLLIAAGVGAFFILLIALFARGIASGLARLTRRVERYAAGEKEEPLPLERHDEIGRLARSLDRMRQRIEQRVAELEQARLKAEESDRARRDFLANMSHEVRTPLNAILGMSQDIDTSSFTSGDRERFALVQRSAQRLKGLVDDLLLNARIGEGRLELRPANTDLRQLMNDIAQSHRPMAESKAIALRVIAERLPTEAITDPLRTYQIIDNLVGNAVKFTRQGQVDVEARLDEEGLLTVTVSDTGPGLSPEECARVFERFERATSAESDGEGAGLGLAITKRLVDLMGGSIVVESEPGRGSRFTVSLPMSASGEGTEVMAPVDAVAVEGLRVLYVEDVASNRMVVERWADAWHWKLALAATAEDALKQCEVNDFDLVLLDLDLGEGMRGSQLGMRLRGLKRLRYVPMLAVTAYVGEEQEAEILKAGLNDRVTKPIDRDELLAKAAYWCGDTPDPALQPSLDRLEEQYDRDAEKLLSVFQQYRREFTQWRVALRQAFSGRDAAAIAAVRHKLRPHVELFGIGGALVDLDRLDEPGVDRAALQRVLELLRACDRALLARQRELQAITAGRAV